ncbi:MAG: polyprenol monophosphomannose synthase [Bdellovibrionaceae bacterium]|nr:polyprenol monophosphomannose synthase [Pseudobdellovibrionaceae bacterium]
MSQLPKVWVVIPSFREAENIARLVTTVRGTRYSPGVVVVDDSPDEETVKAMQPLTCEGEQVHCIHRKAKGGRGSAVLDGLRYALSRGADIVLEMDADFSHPPEQIDELVGLVATDQADMVIGSRYISGSRILNWPISRRIFSKSSNWLAKLVLGVPVADYTNGFRCYSQKAAQEILEKVDGSRKGFIMLSEVLVRIHLANYRIHEVSTCFVNRVRGESSLSVREISGAFMGLWQISALQRQAKSQKRISQGVRQ